jgi:hypothetical protein
MLKAIARHLGRPVGRGARFTFREFVGFLETLDLEEADIHVRQQVHPCERLGLLPDINVVRAEETADVLPRVEQRLGLRRSDPLSLRHSIHDTVRKPLGRFVGDVPMGDTKDQLVPTSSEFYDDALADRVARLYRADLEAYGYERPR